VRALSLQTLESHRSSDQAPTSTSTDDQIPSSAAVPAAASDLCSRLGAVVAALHQAAAVADSGCTTQFSQAINELAVSIIDFALPLAKLQRSSAHLSLVSSLTDSIGLSQLRASSASVGQSLCTSELVAWLREWLLVDQHTVSAPLKHLFELSRSFVVPAFDEHDTDATWLPFLEAVLPVCSSTQLHEMLNTVQQLHLTHWLAEFGTTN
jgi:hypothetical protein